MMMAGSSALVVGLGLFELGFEVDSQGLSVVVSTSDGFGFAWVLLALEAASALPRLVGGFEVELSSSRNSASGSSSLAASFSSNSLAS